MERPNLYIITGGIGCGKTTLVDELCKRGNYNKIPEFCGDFIEEQLKTGGRVLPWIDRHAFCGATLKIIINAYLSALNDKICFCDRGIPDAIAFFKAENLKTPPEVAAVSKNFRYNTKVFVAPPWRKIYRNTSTRPQSFEYSVKLGKSIIETYEELGYKIIEIPRMKIDNRVAFIVNNL